ncbi:MAG: HAD family hydrolase [Candidatus Methanomethylophilaceae archaeon]|nr:HAD family hydrolase [Candidatus Methanomethylophilaceae archaeon]
MREYSLYLFDFDNTLYDTNEGIREILRHALPMVGVEYDDSMFGEFTGLSMDQVFERYVGDWSLYDRYKEEFMRIVRSDVYMTGTPFPETERVLRELRNRGRRLGIVSGKMSFKIENLMGRDGMLDMIETIVGYGDTERHKPFPDPIELALSRFDVPKEDVLYIGDSPNDSGAAINAGIDCAIVNRHNGLTPDGLECTYELDSLEGLL